MKSLRFINLLLLFLLLPGGVSAGERRILLINSDASVEKYETAQTEFKSAVSSPVREVDLGERKWKIQDIEDLLYDTDADLIYAVGTKAYLAANRFAGKKHIVFSSIIGWQRLPVTEKTYGVSSELHPEMQIMLFRYIFPGIRKIGVLYSEKYNSEWITQARSHAGAMGVEIIGHAVEKSGHTADALTAVLPKVDALWLISDPVVLSDKEVLVHLFEACDSKGVPVFSYHEAFARQGAVLTVSVDHATTGRQAAGIAMNVLSGEMIEDKVQFPAGSSIILNLKKVKEYGLQYEEASLGAVNQIIE